MTSDISLRFVLGVLVLCLVSAGLGGAIGAALTSDALDRSAQQLSDTLGASSGFRLFDRAVSVPKGGAAVVLETASPAAVRIYGGWKEGTALDVNAPVSRGVLLTSDGWMAAALAPLPADVKSLAVLVGTRVYRPVSVVPDPLTGTVFLRIEGKDLPVAAFGKTDASQAGDSVFVGTAADELVSASFVGWGAEAGVVSPSVDVPRRFLRLDRALLANQIGAPVFTPQGSLMGLVSETGQKGGEARVVPMESLLPAVRALLAGGKIERASLGIEGLDVAQLPGLSESVTHGRIRGLLVKTVVADGPAAKAGIQAGDILVSVQGKAVSSFFPIERFLADAKPGDVWSVEIDRGDQVLTISVPLGSLPSPLPLL